MSGSRGGRRWSVVLLAGTLASLMATTAGVYATRLALVQADEWVTHTDEVKLALGDCQIALARGDVQLLRESEARVKQLTADNGRQQELIARAEVLAQQGMSPALEAIFADMQLEEDRLKVERWQRLRAARRRSAALFLVASFLTLLFGGGAFVLLRAQRRDLERQRVLLEGIIESIDEGVIALTTSGDVIALNAVARSFWGPSFPRDRWPADWRTALVATYEDGSRMKPEEGPLARALRGDSSDGVVYRVTPAGSPAEAGRWVSASARPLRDASGRVLAAVTTLRDVTDLRAQAEKLRDQSLTDELTGLLNRRGFLALANARVSEARRTKAPMALLYADVNGLKKINDQLGHDQGDRVIECAARALRGALRAGDIVARIGGDEFVALLPNFSQPAHDALLDRLAGAIRAQDADDRPFRLSMSYAVTFMDWDRAQSLEELLADADGKMYERKRARATQSNPVVRVVKRG